MNVNDLRARVRRLAELSAEFDGERKAWDGSIPPLLRSERAEYLAAVSRVRDGVEAGRRCLERFRWPEVLLEQSGPQRAMIHAVPFPVSPLFMRSCREPSLSARG